MRSVSFCCPVSKQPLVQCTLQEAERRAGGPFVARPGKPTATGLTPDVLLREDLQVAYPIVDGIPVLLYPEMLYRGDVFPEVDLRHPHYAEAYEEMEVYNPVAMAEAADIRSSESFACIRTTIDASDEAIASFPAPAHTWIDATYDCTAQWEVYSHLAPRSAGRIAQLGGKGVHAVKFLVAGAAEAWVVTPMIGEIRCALTLAKEAGVADRLHVVVAVGEELPFPPDTFDGVISCGCLHHMDTRAAFIEINRVLRPEGRFGASDPWRAPLYAIGTKLLGKREANVYCRPLTRERVAPMYSAFRRSEVHQFGALVRYPLIALSKFGVNSPFGVAWKLFALDKALSDRVPLIQHWGSSVAVLGEK